MKEDKGNEGNSDDDNAKENGTTCSSVFFSSEKEAEEP